MNQIHLPEAKQGSTIFLKFPSGKQKRCEIIKQYIGFSWEIDKDENRTGKKIPVKRTKLSYVSTYQDKYNDKNGFYSSTSEIVCQKTVDSEGVYVILKDDESEC